jgi:hypothetical protein
MIAAAFADVVHPDAGEIACDCLSKTCEGLAMESEFKPFSWQNVPAQIVDKYARSLPIFTDQGFKYFLPAYMMRALENPDGEVWQEVILGLPGSGAGASLLPPMTVLPGQSMNEFQKVTELLEAHEEERLHEFTTLQIEAMIEFVEYLIANPTERTDEFIEELFSRSESLGAYLSKQSE